MNKKILIGSIIAVALLLLMPSIPAIQQKTIEEGIRQDMQEKLETFNVEDLEDIDLLDGIKHPILYVLVVILLYIRLLQAYRMFEFSSNCAENGQMYLAYLGALRALCIIATTDYFHAFWYIVSNILGWNWNLEPFP